MIVTLPVINLMDGALQDAIVLKLRKRSGILLAEMAQSKLQG
jgi:hypothetical protein